MNELIISTNDNLTVHEPSKTNAAAVYLAGLGSDRSRRTQLQGLEVIADMLGYDVYSCKWGELRVEHAQAIRAKLAEQYAPATANRILSALRGVAGAAFDLYQMSGDDLMRIKRVKSVKGQTLPAGRCISHGELEAVVRACKDDKSPAGARDAAILACLYNAGLRRSEPVKLNLDDYNEETGELRILQGKGNKDRLANLFNPQEPNGAKKAIDAWLDLRGDESGPLFWPVDKGGNLQHRRMTAQAIYNMIAKRSGQANVEDVSPHDFRRTFVTHHLESGTNAKHVQDMAGHANINTTMRYDRSDDIARRKSAGNLHFPY